MSGIAPTATRPTPRGGGGAAPALDSGTRRGDAVFSGAVRGSAILLLILMGAIAAFLIYRAQDALSANTANVVTYTGQWAPDDTPPKFGIGALAWGTLVTSLIAIVIAAPVAVGVALFITQYAPRRLAQVLGYIVDLLAAVPSIIYGLWGILFLVPHMQGASQVVSDVLGWLPPFESGIFGRSVFTAGVILSIMILPIIAAISREVFLQTPRDQVEAAYALGATRWEMIKLAVLPYGRSGVGSAVVLGFGRALGETIAAMATRLGESQQRRRQALEINDNVVQGLTSAVYSLEQEDVRQASSYIERTLAAARDMMDDLLEPSGDDLHPGDLVRSSAAQLDEVRPKPDAAADRSEPAASTAHRVLIVDDAEDIRMLLRMKLGRQAGLDVVGEAGDGIDAVDLARELQPNLVLLDMAMPRMDGLQALPLIRAAVPDVRVIVLSGFNQGTLEKEALAAGADQYVVKGGSMRELLEVIEKVLRVA